MTNYHVYKDDTKPLDCWLLFTLVEESEQRRRVGLKSRSVNRCLNRLTFWTNWFELEFGWKWRAKAGSLTGYENRVWEECHSGDAGTAARSATVTNSFAKIEQCSSFSIKRSSRHVYFIIWLQATGGEKHLSALQAGGTVRPEETSKMDPSAGLFLPERRWRSQWRTNGRKLEQKLTSSQWQPQESKYEHFSPVWCFHLLFTTIVTYANWPYQNQSWPDDVLIKHLKIFCPFWCTETYWWTIHTWVLNLPHFWLNLNLQYLKHSTCDWSCLPNYRWVKGSSEADGVEDANRKKTIKYTIYDF